MEGEFQSLVVSESARNVEMSVTDVNGLRGKLKDFVRTSFGADNIDFSHVLLLAHSTHPILLYFLLIQVILLAWG